MSISDELFFGRAVRKIGTPECEAGIRTTVNELYIRSIGLVDPARFFGLVDKDRNGIFDVQSALEKHRGENYRPWTWLGFESRRRNAQWTHNGSAIFDTSNSRTGVVHVKRKTEDGLTFGPVLAHERLNLKPYTTYQVQFWVYMESPLEQVPIQICLADNGTSCMRRTVKSGKWISQVVTMATSDQNDFYFKMTENATMSLKEVSIIEKAAIMDFDSNDTRYSWINWNTRTRGLTLPEGRLSPEQASSTDPDWAGVVIHPEGTIARRNTWSLVNEQFGMAAYDNFRICFYHRLSRAWPLEDSVVGKVRVENADGVITNSEVSFRPGFTYQQKCTDWFQTVSERNRLMFGAEGEQTRTNGAYYVDDISIETMSSWRSSE